MTPLLRYVLAFIVAAHGLTYIVGGILIPRGLKEWKRSSWLLRSAVTGDALYSLVMVIHVIAGIVIIACAVTVAFAPSMPGIWRPLAIVGAAIGILGFAIFWDGQVQLMAQEGFVGVILSVVMLICALAFGGALG